MSTIHATNDEIVTYNLAGAGIIAIQAIPSFVVFVCSLAITKVHNDPARTWLIQLRIALAFFLVWTVLAPPSWILSVVNNIRYYYAVYHLSNVSGLAVDFATILIFLVLAHLHFGITLARDGSLSRPMSVAKKASYGVAALLGVLSVILFGFYTSLIREPWALGLPIENPSLVKHSQRLGLAFIILLFITGLGVAVAAVWITIKSRHSAPHVRFACRLYLASAIVLLLSRLYTLITTVMWANPNASELVERPIWTIVLPVIFHSLPTFVSLVLVFSLACKKVGGLWTVMAPWAQPAHHDAAFPQAGYGAYGPQPTYGAMAQYQGQYPAPPPAWQQPIQTGPGELSAVPPVNELGGYQRPGELTSDPRAWEMSSTPAPQYAQLYAPPPQHELAGQGGYMK